MELAEGLARMHHAVVTTDSRPDPLDATAKQTRASANQIVKALVKNGFEL